MLYNAACFFARVGERDRALALLPRAFELEPKSREWARTDSDLDPLRGDPSFPA